jgi:hypothetical protein
MNMLMFIVNWLKLDLQFQHVHNTMKLSFYKDWNEKNNLNTDHNKESVNYEIKYKTKFKEYFHHYYEDSTVNLRAKAQRVNDVDKIIHYDNAVDLLLIIL